MDKKVVLVDWITVLQKVPLMKLLNEKANMSLKEAHEIVNKRLGKEIVEVLVDEAIVSEFENQLRALGVVLEGEDKLQRELENLKKTSVPCPYCGKYLRTKKAKQCQHCYMDWHDENNPYRMSEFKG